MKDYARAFYQSIAWKKTRQAYFTYRCGICERCGNAGVIVHHKCYISPNNIDNPHVTLDFKNLELLCHDCHNKEHSAKQKRYTFDASGNILPPPPLKK